MSDFQVFSYSIKQLRKLLSDLGGVPGDAHVTYFEEYFDQLETKTILVEARYIDHDYLEDYADYYARCFEAPGRDCLRLHFFSRKYSKSHFNKVLATGGAELIDDLNKHYLGFVVVKPLQNVVIGRTCLKTYEAGDGRRNFPILKDCQANPFGIPLSVRSLAFQEQDGMVAACASSALWSAFHGSSEIFHHSIPSPVEITKTATAIIRPENRALPNHEGLSIAQMAEAIRCVGLEPLRVCANERYRFQAHVRAYLEAQIPLILLERLLRWDQSKEDWTLTDDGHAVTVTGYEMAGNAMPGGQNPLGLKLRASRIGKIYGHDDQVGPFARMALISKKTDDASAPVALTTSFGSPQLHSALSVAFLIPVYHKIRVPLDDVLPRIGKANQVLESMRRAGEFRVAEEVEWDIRLSTVQKLKRELLDAPNIHAKARQRILLAPLPKYIWRVSAYIQNTLFSDLYFDATGQRSSLMPLDELVYGPNQYQKELLLLHKDALFL